MQVEDEILLLHHRSTAILIGCLTASNSARNWLEEFKAGSKLNRARAGSKSIELELTRVDSSRLEIKCSKYAVFKIQTKCCLSVIMQQTLTMEMISEKDLFSISGPTHLISSLNWKCAHHRRSIAACLVQSVYILERDRQEHHEGPEALAPAWWESFHFELNCKLIDDVDSSIFGAVFEYKPPTSIVSIADAPKFVVAFRGTITKKDSVNRDLMLDLHLIKNSLHQTSRFELAMRAVRNLVSAVGSSNVWLAGHSLGSAVASLAARNMARTGIVLEAYLFNPPFFSAPIERIKDQKVKHGIRIASSLVTAGLSFVLKGQQDRSTSEDPFVALSSWVPNLFINPNDHICSEYIGYFEHRKNMEDLGAGTIEKLATQNSLGDIFLWSLGKESEPLHLLPSAKLTVNLSPSPDFKWAHGIHQWWRPDLHLQTRTYIYS